MDLWGHYESLRTPEEDEGSVGYSPPLSVISELIEEGGETCFDEDSLALVFDLDYTLFNTANLKCCEWMGGADAWVNLCHWLRAYAEKKGLKLHFAIATAKTDPDDLVLEAATHLQPFLSLWNEDNQQFEGVFDKDGYLRYNHFDIAKRYKYPPSQILKSLDSNYTSSIQIAVGTKEKLLQNISRLHRVPFSNMTMVDDQKDVLAVAYDLGCVTFLASGLWQPIQQGADHQEEKKARDRRALEFIEELREGMVDEIDEVAFARKPIPKVFPQYLKEKGLRADKNSAPKVAKAIISIATANPERAQRTYSQYCKWAGFFKPNQLHHPAIRNLKEKLTAAKP